MKDANYTDLYRNQAETMPNHEHEDTMKFWNIQISNSHQIDFKFLLTLSGLSASCPTCAWLLTGKDWSKKSATFVDGKALPENEVPSERVSTIRAVVERLFLTNRTIQF